VISPPKGIPHRLKHRRVGSFEEWRAYEVESGERRRRIHESEAAMASPPPPLVRDGMCHVCRKRTQFTYSTSNLREDLVCGECNLINRLRASVWLFEVECRPRRGSAIYLTEQVTQLYAVLAHRYPGLQGSEYLGPGVALGEVAGNVRNESLTALTFASGSFSYLLSFECFEHIPDYGQAFRECARVLRPGGRMVFSVPFLRDAETTLVRAKIGPGGEIEHILEPEYHGDPLSNAGCLCYQHFGWDILDSLREAGFSRAWACVYWSQRFAYLGGEQIQFVAVR
jgi:SAM-dependent methyltransferase